MECGARQLFRVVLSLSLAGVLCMLDRRETEVAYSFVSQGKNLCPSNVSPSVNLPCNPITLDPFPRFGSYTAKKIDLSLFFTDAIAGAVSQEKIT